MPEAGSILKPPPSSNYSRFLPSRAETSAPHPLPRPVGHDSSVFPALGSWFQMSASAFKQRALHPTRCSGESTPAASHNLVAKQVVTMGLSKS